MILLIIVIIVIINLLCSIVDDSTGTVRRFKKMILEECPQLGSDSGASWFKLDSSNNNTLKRCISI